MQRRDFLSLPLIAASASVLPGRAQAHSMPASVSKGAAPRGPASRVLTRVVTASGAFTIMVDKAVAPITVANYLAYVDRQWLDNGQVYRVVTARNQPAGTEHRIQVVQWGMNLPDDRKPPLPAIQHETTQMTGLRHVDGTVSMARGAPGTAATEFFICLGDQPELDFGGHRNPDGQGFAAFGQVVQGMSVVRAIYKLALAPGQTGKDQLLRRPIPVRSVRRIAPAK